MTRSSYTIFILAVAIGVPLLTTAIALVAPINERKRFKIPNRDYWLELERREQTLRFLRVHGLAFPPAISLFLGYVHWLVVKANEQHPPVLSQSAMIFGLIAFLAYLAIWIGILFIRFRKKE